MSNIRSMRWILIVFFLTCSFPFFGQDKAKIEKELSESVAGWKANAAALDDLTVAISRLYLELHDLEKAIEWMEDAEADAPGSKNDKSSSKALRKSKKRLKSLRKKIRQKEKEANRLTEKIEAQKIEIDKLVLAKQQLEDDNSEHVVFSGYFPAPKEFYYPDEKENLLFYPPKRRCIIAFEGKDPQYEKLRVELGEEEFFTYQPANIRLRNNRAYLTCYSNMILLEGGQYFLRLRFLIQTPEFRKAFGYLDRGSRLIIKFIGGKELVLQNNKVDIGHYNRHLEAAIYTAQYSLNLEAQNLLKHKKIDSVLVEWSKGYDIYPVYKINLLGDQIRCF